MRKIWCWIWRSGGRESILILFVAIFISFTFFLVFHKLFPSKHFPFFPFKGFLKSVNFLFTFVLPFTFYILYPQILFLYQYIHLCFWFLMFSIILILLLRHPHFSLFKLLSCTLIVSFVTETTSHDDSC